MKTISRIVVPLLLCSILCLFIAPAVFAYDGGICIPDSVTVIEAEAFTDNTSITSVTIPEIITMIGERAFYGCINLKDVYYLGTEEKWDEVTINSGNGPLMRATFHFLTPAGPVTLVYAEVNPIEGTISGEMAKAFKARVEELSGGNVRIDLQGSGVMGSESQVLSSMLSINNAIDIARISAAALEQYGCEGTNLLTLPYTFSDINHFMAFTESELAQDILNEPQETGLPIRGLCFGTEGFRHFFFRNAVNSIDDLNGRKIRVANNSTMFDMVSSLNASPIAIPFTELYSALNTGVADGSEQPVANYLSNFFFEVAPHVILDGHVNAVTEIVVSDTCWSKLNSQQQNWVQEAAAYASRLCCEEAEQVEYDSIQQLRQKGVTVVEVADKEPWRTACWPSTQQAVAGQEELYQKVLALQATTSP